MTIKRLAVWALTLGAMGVAAGCSGNKKSASADIPQDPSVTEVSAAPAPVYVAPAAPAYTPPSDSATVTPVSSAMGASYTIKPGDTLYSIAKAKYGDGKQWNRIVSANPGLNPQKLKVGQTITLP